MGEKSGISYVHHSWGCWRGCHRIAQGCDNCYASRDMKRYGRDHSVVERARPATFNAPLKWNAEAAAAGEIRRVFVTPWSDPWLVEADEWRADALRIIESCPALVFVSPSKRLHRVKQLNVSRLPDNLWPLASVSDGDDLARVTDALLDLRDRVKVWGLSYEPALGPLHVALLNVLRPKWIVAGCESQSHTTPGRPVHPECFRMVRNWCAAYGVPFYLKQMEVDGRLVHEPELDGVRHLEIP